MELRIQIASVMLYVFSAFIILFGLVYLISPRIMPYHERFLGRKFEELKKNDPKIATLSVASLKIIGALALALGIGFVMIIKYQFSANDPHAWWIILVMSLAALVPVSAVSFSIGGLRSLPGWIITACILLMSAAMIISCQ